MDKELLIRVLGTSSRVVIPTFGAFLRKQQGDTLVFSPFLKTDDGFLASVVRNEYNISQEEANSMIAAFAEHVSTVLRARSKFYVDGVGTLVVDDNGAVAFVMDTTRQIPPAQPVAAQPAPTPIAEPQPVALPVVEPIAQPIAQTQAEPVIAPRPVAPQPISAARQPYAPPIAQQPVATPAPTPIRPTAAPQPIAPRPVTPGGFARPMTTPTAAPISQQQQQQQPPAAAPITPVTTTPPSTQTPANAARPVAADRPMNRTAVGTNSNNGQHRPAPRRRKSKNDVWLVVAIIAALVVIVLMVIGILTASEANSMQL